MTKQDKITRLQKFNTQTNFPVLIDTKEKNDLFVDYYRNLETVFENSNQKTQFVLTQLVFENLI